jgi:hypothetical protein
MTRRGTYAGKMQRGQALAAAGLLGALLLAGCETLPNERKNSFNMPTSHPYGAGVAFPDRLAPIADDPGALGWRDPEVDFRKYRQFFFEPIHVSLDPDSTAVDPGDRKALADHFRQALDKAVAPPYAIAEKSGPGVLRARITILDLVAAKAEDCSTASAAALVRTAIAVDFLDGASGDVVAEFTDTRFGQKYPADPANACSSWAYAKQAFDQWALRFRRQIDLVQGK